MSRSLIPTKAIKPYYLRIELPFNCFTKKVTPPVSKNRMWKPCINEKTGKPDQALTPAYIEFSEFLKKYITLFVPGHVNGPPAEYLLHIHCVFPDDSKTRDAHNYIDAICDILEGVVYENDEQLKGGVHSTGSVGSQWGLYLYWERTDKEAK